MSVKSLYVLAAVAALSCAPAATTTQSGTRTNSNMITAEEIASSGASNAFEAVSRLRPQFLRNRGKSSISGNTDPYATVYVNEQRLGGLSTLSTVNANQIVSIRYMSGIDAMQKFGIEASNGAILIVTK